MESRDREMQGAEMSEYSVVGGWLGTYYGENRAEVEPARFEATFSSQGREGRFDGAILDDNNLGEAKALEGMQSGLSVAFVKVYVKPPRGHSVVPVEYEGTLSEDGKRLSGTWRLKYRESKKNKVVRQSGTWEAHRLWYDLSEETATPERESLLVGMGR